MARTLQGTIKFLTSEVQTVALRYATLPTGRSRARDIRGDFVVGPMTAAATMCLRASATKSKC
jgi:hypothetical protein